MKTPSMKLTIALIVLGCSSAISQNQYSDKGMYSRQDAVPVVDQHMTIANQSVDEIVAHLMGVVGNGEKGWTARGRWVDVKQDDIDACYKMIGVAPYRPKQGAGTKNWGGGQTNPQAANQPLNVPLSYSNNQYLPDADGLRHIAKLAQALKHPQLAHKRLLIEGHANATGTNAQNIDVTCSRAAKVRELLRDLHGIDEHRLDVVGKGAKEPIPNVPANDPSNRRVVLRLINN